MNLNNAVLIGFIESESDYTIHIAGRKNIANPPHFHLVKGNWVNPKLNVRFLIPDKVPLTCTNLQYFNKAEDKIQINKIPAETLENLVLFLQSMDEDLNIPVLEVLKIQWKKQNPDSLFNQIKDKK